jgi:hypothetical protein
VPTVDLQRARIGLLLTYPFHSLGELILTTPHLLLLASIVRPDLDFLITPVYFSTKFSSFDTMSSQTQGDMQQSESVAKEKRKPARRDPEKRRQQNIKAQKRYRKLTLGSL